MAVPLEASLPLVVRSLSPPCSLHLHAIIPLGHSDASRLAPLWYLSVTPWLTICPAQRAEASLDQLKKLSAATEIIISGLRRFSKDTEMFAQRISITSGEKRIEGTWPDVSFARLSSFFVSSNCNRRTCRAGYVSGGPLSLISFFFQSKWSLLVHVGVRIVQ